VAPGERDIEGRFGHAHPAKSLNAWTAELATLSELRPPSRVSRKLIRLDRGTPAGGNSAKPADGDFLKHGDGLEELEIENLPTIGESPNFFMAAASARLIAPSFAKRMEIYSAASAGSNDCCGGDVERDSRGSPSSGGDSARRVNGANFFNERLLK